ncbi:MAG: hypothetical protein ACOX0W_00595 [Sphaerochaetaceae bacterium]|jgi:phosphate/sulfate permease
MMILSALIGFIVGAVVVSLIAFVTHKSKKKERTTATGEAWIDRVDRDNQVVVLPKTLGN